MKTVLHNALGRPAALLLGGALLCLAAGAQAQNDPSGTWDFVISGGSQRGVAFMTFEKDQTLSGFEIITTYTPPESADSGRGNLGIDRSGSPSGGSSSNQFLFGFTAITGSWNYDSKGRTIGFFNEGAEAGGDLAQSASFIATVKPGRRINMKVTDSPNPESLNFNPRHRVYKGIPLEPTDDVSGDYYANGKKTSVASTNSVSSSQEFIELFNLTSFDTAVANDPAFFDNYPFFSAVVPPASANAYFLAGKGPGYTNWGLVLFSAQKRMALVTVSTDVVNTNDVLRSVSGNFNVGSGLNGAGKLYGIDLDSARTSLKVNRLP